MSTDLPTASGSNEETTTSVGLIPQVSSSLLPYKTALIVIGVMGALSNGVVLLGFGVSDRSKITASMAHIANHTTLEL